MDGPFSCNSPCNQDSCENIKIIKRMKGASIVRNHVVPPLPLPHEFPEHIRGLQTIIGVGKNYAKHVDEMWQRYEKDLKKNESAPAPPARPQPAGRPILFQKPKSSLVFDSPLKFPRSVGPVHHEIELAVLIGKPAYHVRKEDALDFIQGFTVGLDMTARDPQTQAKDEGKPWCVAKGMPHFLPLCKRFLGTADLVADIRGRVVAEPQSQPSASQSGLPYGAEFWLELKVNGALRQQTSTRDLIYGVPLLIEHITKVFPLMPGDLIMTGTPEGVAGVEEGDHVELEMRLIESNDPQLMLACDYHVNVYNDAQD